MKRKRKRKKKKGIKGGEKKKQYRKARVVDDIRYYKL